MRPVQAVPAKSAAAPAGGSQRGMDGATRIPARTAIRAGCMNMTTL